MSIPEGIWVSRFPRPLPGEFMMLVRTYNKELDKTMLSARFLYSLRSVENSSSSVVSSSPFL
jgi:hypothetical protein